MNLESLILVMVCLFEHFFKKKNYLFNLKDMHKKFNVEKERFKELL